MIMKNRKKIKQTVCAAVLDGPGKFILACVGVCVCMRVSRVIVGRFYYTVYR